MTIDGIYYTEPELMAKFRQMQATIDRLDSENYKLTEKLDEIGTAFNEQVSLVGWHEEREKEYKQLLKAAIEDINFYVVCDDCYEAHCDECCCDQDNHCHWKHEAETLALIGEGGENDA